MLGMYRLVMLALAFCWVGHAGAAELTPYLKSALDGRPRTNAGLRFEHGALRMRADIALNAESAIAKAMPQVTSEWAPADQIYLVTHLRLPDWRGGGASGTVIDTRLHFEPRTVFIDRIEGRIHQGPTGVRRHTVKLGFSDNLAQSVVPRSLAIRGNAVIEETLRPEDENSRSIGVEAIVTGLPTTRLGLDLLRPGSASSRLSLRVRRSTGAASAEQERVASLAYGHSWDIQDFAEVGLELEARRAADGTEPALGISWKAAF